MAAAVKCGGKATIDCHFRLRLAGSGLSCLPCEFGHVHPQNCCNVFIFFSFCFTLIVVDHVKFAHEKLWKIFLVQGA